MASTAFRYCGFFLLLTCITPTQAQDASLGQCQQWHSQIEYYTDLRRAGGRAQQMESWKQLRTDYEDKFKEARCKKYGKEARK